MESPKRAPADPSKRVWRAAVLGWLLSLAAARGVTIDPEVVLQLNSGSLSTLSLRVVEKRARMSARHTGRGVRGAACGVRGAARRGERQAGTATGSPWRA